MASNILFLASKKCFLTSQGIVSTGMNCRAMTLYIDSKQYIKHDIIYFSPNCGRDCMVVGFTTTYTIDAISAYQH